MNIKEIEKHYTITVDGLIIKLKNGKAMSQTPDRAGYPRTYLTINKRRHAFYIHRLLAFKYVKGRSRWRQEVNHIDGNKTNNLLVNLEWVTHKENMTHAKDVLKVMKGNTSKTLKTKMIRYLTSEFRNKDIAEVFATTSENISRIKNAK